MLFQSETTALEVQVGVGVVASVQVVSALELLDQTSEWVG